MLNLERSNGELAGTVQLVAPKDGLDGATISGALAAQLIDELPVLAAIAPYTRTASAFAMQRNCGLRNRTASRWWRRICAPWARKSRSSKMASTFPVAQTLHGAEIDSGGDHRIAMAFSVAALRARESTIIHGAESAAISFPEFFALLDQVAAR